MTAAEEAEEAASAERQRAKNVKHWADQAAQKTEQPEPVSEPKGTLVLSSHKPGKPKPGKPGKRTGGGKWIKGKWIADKDQSDPRVNFAWSRLPRVPIQDRELSLAERGLFAVIADMINYGPQNADLHRDTNYAELAQLGSTSESTVKLCLRALKGSGHLKVESLGRGGIRLWMTPPPPKPK